MEPVRLQPERNTTKEWAKVVRNLVVNGHERVNGYSFEGRFVNLGELLFLPVGAILLHHWVANNPSGPDHRDIKCARAYRVFTGSAHADSALPGGLILQAEFYGPMCLALVYPEIRSLLNGEIFCRRPASTVDLHDLAVADPDRDPAEAMHLPVDEVTVTLPAGLSVAQPPKVPRRRIRRRRTKQPKEAVEHTVERIILSPVEHSIVDMLSRLPEERVAEIFRRTERARK